MARFTIIFLIAAVFAVNCDEDTKQKCPGENQEWNECGSGCEERCIKPKNPRVCAAVCVPKCSCKPGYIIGPDGNCISKKECSEQKCVGQNQFWNDCGSNCEARCIEPEDPLICPAVCLSKCSCKPGYVIGPDGKCISKEQCSAIKCVGQNQVWNECGSDCEPRCIEPEEPRVCPDVCVPKCSCKPGYLIGKDGECVTKDDCDNCSEE